MSDLTLPGHEAKLVDKPDTKYGYGDMPYSSSEPYLVCSCGFQKHIKASNFRIERIEHYMVVLSGQWVDERPEYKRLQAKYG